MMPKTVNIAIVGCGGMAQHYLTVYRDLDWVHVTACIDTNPEVAKRAAQMLRAALATTDLKAALSPSNDAVIINTPNHFHREQAIAAMEAGKHVLLQKPVSASLADAEAIAQVASRSNVISGLYMSYFDQPLVHDIRDLVRSGIIGDPVHFYGRLMHKGGLTLSAQALSGNRSWRASVEETGGGCFIQLAVHYLRLFQWMSGCHVVNVTAITTNVHCPGLEGEDLACAVLQLDSGAMMTLDTAWCTNGEQWAIHGTLGRIEYRNNRWFSMASSRGPYRGRVIHYPGHLESSFDGIHGVEHQIEIRPPSYGDASNPYNQQRMFLEAVRDGRPAFCSIASGVEDLRVVHAVYESAKCGRRIALRSL
jgi:UDP-N-acetyl-2-amino-2-deoxyglucuronate dehydrogenase